MTSQFLLSYGVIDSGFAPKNAFNFYCSVHISSGSRGHPPTEPNSFGFSVKRPRRTSALLSLNGKSWIRVSYRVRKSSEYADGYGRYSGFYSTSLLFGTGCVYGPGSLSGGAFNQLKLVTLNNVRTFLY